MMRKRLVFGALGIVAAIAAGTAVLAQIPGLFIASPTGLEQINVTVPSTGTAVTSPQIASITVNQIRNATGKLLVGTGTTVTSTPTNATGCLIATGAITTWNITLPNPAYDGEDFCVTNGTGASFTTNTTVTAAATPQVQTLAQAFSAQTVAAGASVQWIFDLPTLTWYRMR